MKDIVSLFDKVETTLHLLNEQWQGDGTDEQKELIAQELQAIRVEQYLVKKEGE